MQGFVFLLNQKKKWTKGEEIQKNPVESEGSNCVGEFNS